MSKNVYAVYCSPTYTSKKNVKAIAGEFGKIQTIDITQGMLEEKMFLKEDIVVFGTPVYGGRIPSFVVDRLKRFKGNNTKCIVTVTYGNRDYDDALLELMDIVCDNGFIVVGCASLIGEHTYGTIQVGRPNSDDLLAHKEFARKVQLKIQNEDVHPIKVKGNRPYKLGGAGGKFRPLTNSELCINCGLCKLKCPMQAISEDNRTIDNNSCIACFRCIKNCPVHAKNMDTPEYIEFSKAFTKRLEKTRENEYFL